MTISFIIPFRTDFDYREESYQFVRSTLSFYTTELSIEWEYAEVITADSCDVDFNRSKSRNHGAQLARGEVYVFIDADSITPLPQMSAAIDTVHRHGGWAFPYDSYCSLTQTGSKKYREAPVTIEREDFAYIFPSVETPEPSVGGCVVVHREAYEHVRGYDERFLAWGEEDRAFALALTTLVGTPFVAAGPLYHLWHPAPESGRFEHPSFMDNRVLCNRYREAEGNSLAMRSLVDERL